MRLFRLRALAPRAVVVFALVSCTSPDAKKVEMPAWLAERARVQRELAGKSAVISDFLFAERGDSSGITFVNRIVDDLTVGGSHFLPEMVILALKRGLRVIEIPVNYRGRVGESKITGTLKGTLRTGTRMILLIVRLRFS